MFFSLDTTVVSLFSVFFPIVNKYNVLYSIFHYMIKLQKYIFRLNVWMLPDLCKQFPSSKLSILQQRDTRINIGNICFCKPWIHLTFYFSSNVTFSILSWDSAVLMVWFGLGTKNTVLGFGKDHVLSQRLHFCCCKHSWENVPMSHHKYLFS